MEQKYIITYSNHLLFEGRVLAFRKKSLFDITSTPVLIPLKGNGEYLGWWVGKKFLSTEKAKELIINESRDVDVSNLQWHEQEKLNGVFNL